VLLIIDSTETLVSPETEPWSGAAAAMLQSSRPVATAAAITMNPLILSPLCERLADLASPSMKGCPSKPD
jgi:hypothetical protein